MELEDADACWSAVKDVVWAEDTILGGVKNKGALHNTFSTFGGTIYGMYTKLLLLLSISF